MDQACERCGTFAVLESNGFRSLCGPCWALSRHRLESRDTSVGAMAGTLGSLLAHFWKPALGLFLLDAIPRAALAWWREVPPWFSIPYDVVVGSFFEAVLLCLVTEEILGARTGLKGALRLAESRFFAAVAVNTIATIAVIAGMMALCLPAVAIEALISCALPLVLFERMAPHRALWESGRRSRPAFWRIALLRLGTMTLSLLPMVLSSVARGVAMGSQHPFSEKQAALVRVAVVFAGIVTDMPSVFLQLVVWGATRSLLVPAVEPAPRLRQGTSTSSAPTASTSSED